jgi:hypothetical protein
MDAYQYFYDAAGVQVGHAPAGRLEWDDAAGSEDWAFPGFARYRLLDGRHREVARSGKRTFCVQENEAVDYLVKNAMWQPDRASMHSNCADGRAVALRHVLQVGNGDMEALFTAGEAFDVTELPNGVYVIEIAVNPRGELHESSTANNVSLRRVILGGEPGARTVTVPPHRGIAG